MDVRFFQLEALAWLWVVLAVIVVIVYGTVRRQRALHRLVDAALLPNVLPDASTSRRVIRSCLRPAAMLFLVVALIDPRWGTAVEDVRRSGIDLLVLLDVSRSMLAEDTAPNRLERAKQYIEDLLEETAGDRVGLIVFAGTPTMVSPLTVDTGAVGLVLATVAPESAGRGGSLIGDAIRFANDAFLDDDPEHKAIVLISDGEDHGSFPLEAIDGGTAPIYALGIGDRVTGARIPVTTAGGTAVNLTYDGEEVWTKLDEEQLRTIALASGGAYIPVGTETVDMAQIYRELIEPMTRRDFESTSRQRYVARYQYFALIALMMLIAELFMGERRRGVVDTWLRRAT